MRMSSKPIASRIVDSMVRSPEPGNSARITTTASAKMMAMTDHRPRSGTLVMPMTSSRIRQKITPRFLLCVTRWSWLFIWFDGQCAGHVKSAHTLAVPASAVKELIAADDDLLLHHLLDLAHDRADAQHVGQLDRMARVERPDEQVARAQA